MRRIAGNILPARRDAATGTAGENIDTAPFASRRDRFTGEHSCRGRCRTVDCTRVLKYVATAAYRT